MAVEEPKWLHVYPSYMYHDHVEIVGTAESLRALAAQLVTAANRGVAAEDYFVNDGEGYGIAILRVDDLDARNDIEPHYVAEFAGGPRTSGGLPLDLRKRLAAARPQQSPAATPCAEPTPPPADERG